MGRQLAQQLTLPWFNGSSDTTTAITGFANFKFANLGQIINEAMRYVFAFAGIGLLLMIVAAGYGMLTSAGDSKKMAAGQQRLTNAVIGFIIIAVAYWLTQIAGTIFGFTQIQDIFK